MNTRLHINLANARAELLKAMDTLHHFRKGGFPPEMVEAAMQRRHRAADRAWEAQCMAQSVFG